MYIKRSALHFSAEKVMNSLLAALLFSECCQKRIVTLPSPRELAPLIHYLLTKPDISGESFRQNIRAYMNYFAMVCVKADWVSRGPETFTFNSDMPSTVAYTTILVLRYSLSILNLSLCPCIFTTRTLLHSLAYWMLSYQT